MSSPRDIITIHMPDLGFTEAQIEQLEDAYTAGLVVVLGGDPLNPAFPINTSVQTVVASADAAGPPKGGKGGGGAQKGKKADKKAGKKAPRKTKK